MSGSKVFSGEVFLGEDEKFPSIQGFIEGDFKFIKKDDKNIKVELYEDNLVEFIVKYNFQGRIWYTPIYIEISFENDNSDGDDGGKYINIDSEMFRYSSETLELFFADIKDSDSTMLNVCITN